MMTKKQLLKFSLISFAISIVLPVYFKVPIEKGSYGFNLDGFGYEFISLGWFTILDSILDFMVWFANITLLLTWIFRKKKFAKYLAMFTLGMMLIYAFDYVTHLKMFLVIYYDQIPCGYFFWLASGVLMMLYFRPEKSTDSTSEKED